MTKPPYKNKLDALEKERLAAQKAFDLAVPQSERNVLGQFATPPALAEAMAALARGLFPGISPVRFLDPALGTGVFFSALCRVFGCKSIASASGFEIDQRLAEHASNLWDRLGLKVKPTDFTQACPPSNDGQKANLIICNPPYVRHHHIDRDVKGRLQKRVGQLGIEINGLAGLYCYFLLLADEWLTPDGGALWIVPAEFLDVNYGTALKHYLAERVTTLRIHRFHPADVQFDDALVTSVILAFRKKTPPANHRIALTAGPNLLQPEFSRQISHELLNPKEKWSRFFTSPKFVPSRPDRPTLADIFSIKRGLATGANSFFIMKESEAQAFGLPSEFLRPVIPSQRLVPHDVIKADADGFPRDLPRFVLLDCPLPPEVVAERYPKLHRYLQKGEEQKIHKRYLTRNRSPWYSQEYRPPAPIICTYMARRKKDGSCFRFIRNYSQATAFNVYLLLYPKDEVASAMRADPEILDGVFQYLKTAQRIEQEGRVYGGGLHKLEPKELGNLELPKELVEKVRALAGADHSVSVQQSMRLA
jgi:adenine-specific DNA-methyltransferase